MRFPCFAVLLAIGLAFMTQLTAGASPLSCLRLMSPQYPYENPANNFLKTSAEIRSLYLAEGASARVFLTKDKKADSGISIKKIYNHDGHGSQRFEEDLSTLELLRKLSQGSTFAIPEAKREISYQAELEMTELSLVMSFVPGRTLHDLLLDKNLAPRTRAQVIEVYKAKLASTERELTRHGLAAAPIQILRPSIKYFADGALDDAPMLATTLEGRHQLLIKTDNVIVDPFDLQKMTIIDPY